VCHWLRQCDKRHWQSQWRTKSVPNRIPQLRRTTLDSRQPATFVQCLPKCRRDRSGCKPRRGIPPFEGCGGQGPSQPSLQRHPSLLTRWAAPTACPSARRKAQEEPSRPLGYLRRAIHAFVYRYPPAVAPGGKLTYAHENPFRVSLVASPCDWAFSPARHYEQRRSLGMPIRWAE